MPKEFIDVIEYITYTTDNESGETVIEYQGTNYQSAANAFLRQREHLQRTKPINKDATVVFKNNYLDKVLDTYNTLDDD